MERWIAQLKDGAPEVRAAAHAELLALGKAAVAPLVAQLAQADDVLFAACLEVLNDLGPLAGAAVRVLAEMIKDRRLDRSREHVLLVMTTLAELIPHHEGSEPLTEGEHLMIAFELGLTRDAAGAFALWRLGQRSKLVAKAGLDALRRAVAGRDALAAEVAIERLGMHGGAAAGALPVLRGVLDRPEPRLLLTDRRLPLHRKAAQAILRIAPDGADAAVARQVLAGTWLPPVAAEPEVPERLRNRIGELLRELRSSEPRRRSAAADNLVALGAASAQPVATLLAPDETDDTIRAALDVLRRLGKQAVPAAPAIADALLVLPAPHTIDVLRTLATTLPWTTDALGQPNSFASVGRLKILGRSIGGTIDVAFLNEFAAAQREFQIALAVPVDAGVVELGELLADGRVAKRKRALEVIAARGSECVELLPKLVVVLESDQPSEQYFEQIDARSDTAIEVDRTDEIQRLAAAAILAVAPADHPKVPAARDRLALPAGK